MLYLRTILEIRYMIRISGEIVWFILHFLNMAIHEIQTDLWNQQMPVWHAIAIPARFEQMLLLVLRHIHLILFVFQQDVPDHYIACTHQSSRKSREFRILGHPRRECSQAELISTVRLQ